jgi:hypothetical protein
VTDQQPPLPGSAPPPDPTGNPAPPLPSYPQPPVYTPPPASPPPADPYAQQAYPPPPVDPFAQQAYPPPGYPPQQYGYPGYPPPVDPSLNGFAIASLVCGILGCITLSAVLSIVFGFIALSQIRTRGQRGRGLAIAGISLSGVWLLVLAGVLAYALAQDPSTSAGHTPSDTVVPTVVASSTPTAEPTETPTEESTTTDELTVGQCLNDIKGARTVVSCKTPHEGEVFGVFTLKNGKWPGQATVKKQAVAGCDARLPKYAKNPNRLDYFYGYPDAFSWPDDRTVVCVAADPDGKKLTGSVRR